MEDVKTARWLLMLFTAITAPVTNVRAETTIQLSQAQCESLSGTVINDSQIGIPSGQAQVNSAEWILARPLSMLPLVVSPLASVIPATPDFCRSWGELPLSIRMRPTLGFKLIFRRVGTASPSSTEAPASTEPSSPAWACRPSPLFTFQRRWRVAT
jgi:hypothetical protein